MSVTFIPLDSFYFRHQLGTHYLSEFFFWRVRTKLQKATMSFGMSVGLSVRMKKPNSN